MKLLVLSGAAVRELLAPGDTADAMRAALTALARGEVDQPLRTVLKPERAAGLMGLMPAYLSGRDPAFAVKAICVMPGNPARGLDSHQGVVLLSSAGNRRAPGAAERLGGHRDPHRGGLRGRHRATGPRRRHRAGHHRHRRAGPGAPAGDQRLAAADRGPGGRAGRGPGRTGSPRSWHGPAGLPVTACGSAEEAVAGAGIVVTATSSAEPVLRRDWLAPGTHINAVGACLPRHRELDAQTVAAAGFFADSRESVRGESGDFLLALAEGAIGPDHIRAELGEILVGSAPGRADDDEITVFESLGVAVEDLAAAALAYRKAAESGAGTWLEF